MLRSTLPIANYPDQRFTPRNKIQVTRQDKPGGPPSRYAFVKLFHSSFRHNCPISMSGLADKSPARVLCAEA